MNKKNLSRARKMAQESIYDDAQYVGRWNDFEVYEPIFNDDEEHFIGLPQYILAKGDTLRWTNDTEGLDILRDLPED